MLVSGELERPKNTPLWQKAFELYMASTGDRAVSLGCSNCYGKVKEWLNK